MTVNIFISKSGALSNLPFINKTSARFIFFLDNSIFHRYKQGKTLSTSYYILVLVKII
jgi:hypothetical protein